MGVRVEYLVSCRTGLIPMGARVEYLVSCRTGRIPMGARVEYLVACARGVYRWVHKCNTSFEGCTGPYPVNLRAQYRRCMSSTPETGHLACTSVVPRFGPHGVYTVGYTRAVSRFKAARGRIPLICARSIDAVSHRRPRQEV